MSSTAMQISIPRSSVRALGWLGRFLRDERGLTFLEWLMILMAIIVMVIKLGSPVLEAANARGAVTMGTFDAWMTAHKPAQ